MDPLPFDRSELQNCFFCAKGMMHSNDLHFYEITVGQCLVDLNSVRQQHGLEVMMGAAAELGAVFAPSTNVAHRLPTVRRLICAQCAMTEQLPISCYLEEGTE